jgi:hypothetical protein
MTQKGCLPGKVSCFRNKTFLEMNKDSIQKILMRSEKIQENAKIFQRHPAQLLVKEKQNKNIKSCGKCL